MPGITTIIDACHSSRSPEYTDAALDALDDAGIRSLHMVGAAMDNKALTAHLPADLKRLAGNWNHGDGLVRVGLFGQLNLDWWKVARGLDIRILTEFIGDLAKLGPAFAEPGVFEPHNIFNHCTRVPQEPGSCLRMRASTSPLTRAQMRCSGSTMRASPTSGRSITDWPRR